MFSCFVNYFVLVTYGLLFVAVVVECNFDITVVSLGVVFLIMVLSLVNCLLLSSSLSRNL